jgi:hypothetical protein
VLAGRSRDERACYAALIARTAAGPRTLTFDGALAAPMAGPMFGEKSIVHRLRSLSMYDITRRRRWFGHGLLAAGAFALPLTASFSYAAGAQVPEPSAPPAPPAPEAAPEPPAPPAPPEATKPQVRTFVLQRQDGDESERPPVVRQFTLRRDGNASDAPPIPPIPPVPHIEFHGSADPSDPEFEARMEEFGRRMEEWGKKFGEQYAAQAQAWAETARNTPEVVQSCDESEQRRTQTEDGRPRVVICERQIQLAAQTGLRGARNAIARNRAISDEVRTEILSDLDKEIERIEREND